MCEAPMFTEYSEPLRVRNGGSRLWGGVVFVEGFQTAGALRTTRRVGVPGRLIAKAGSGPGGESATGFIRRGFLRATRVRSER